MAQIIPVSQKEKKTPIECLCGKIYVSILLSPHNLWAFLLIQNQYFIKSYLELINNDVLLGWARTVKLDYTKNINNLL